MFNEATHVSLVPRLLPGSSRATDESRELDRVFRTYYIERMLPVARVALGVWIACVIAVTALDALLMPAAFFDQTVMLRLLGMLAPLALALAATFFVRQRRWLPYITAFAALFAGAMALVISALATQIGATDVYWSTVFALSCIYLLLGLTLRQSICAAWPLFIGYLALISISAVPTQESAYGILFLALLSFVGTISSYLLERNAREAFDNRQELKRLARTDGLTGLFSRRAFDQHSMGDGCIRAVADVIAASVNRPLDMVARYGGEEFVIVLYDPTASFLETFTQGLCQKVVGLDVEHKASETAPIVSLSIGAAITEAAGHVNPDHLIRQADDALYEAKKQGRNQAIVYRAEWGKQTTASLAAVLT